MTTAHRPTWYNAIGGENQGGNRKVSQTAKVCSRDLPGHMQMKTRDLSDHVEDKELIKNNLIQLENSGNKVNNNNSSSSNKDKLRAIENIKKLTNHDYTNLYPEDEDDEIEEEWISQKRKKIKIRKKLNERMKGKTESMNMKKNNNNSKDNTSDKANDNSNNGNCSSDEAYADNDYESNEEEDEEDETDEEDEEEKELMRELEILKREKMEKLKKEKEEQELMKNKNNNILTNNPLINLEDSSENEESEKNKKKRKWTDEAIFRNTCEKKEKKVSFINDTVRTSFHKKFLFKYIH
ncbi:pre-mRNA-splicing factor CWC15, putative [Plasmodium malariae]|uniref:Pre-mRNA-splicing factor CWC15, putative n=1 Tax=Plasmodium malariae TaxID=5858 RepID=A0A1C3KAE3_PLAMA|nr:pre-mRNA-splicing factor CWC15, putative [Plasmodium malariae]